MSHELRTPLTAVLGYAEVMGMGLRGPLPPAYVGDIEAIESGGRHLLAIIDEVLDITRIELGGYRIALEETDLTAVARECAAMMAQQCRDKGIDLGLPDAPPIFRCSDAKAIQQILINLIGNAIKYTPAGGTITVAATREPIDDKTMITVSDTGCGIPAEKLSEVFEPFQRADPLHADPTRGVGLGLAICRRLADLLGCNLAIDSAEGKGTSISLVFGDLPSDGR